MRVRRFGPLLGAVALGVALASPAQGVSATGAVQVTNDPAPLRSHSSPQIAVNPKTGDLVTVESDVRGNRACAVHLRPTAAGAGLRAATR